MRVLIFILIIFFTLLTLCQIYNSNFKEGMDNASQSNTDYKEYNKTIADNTLIMTQQNAGNIEYLKQRIDAVQSIFNQVQDLSGNVTSLQEQVNSLVTAQQDYASQMVGTTPPNITGAVSDKDTL